MKKKNFNLLNFLYILIIFIVIFFIINTFFLEDRISTTNYNLEKDGLCLLPNILLQDEIDKIKEMCYNKNYKESFDFITEHSKLKNECLKLCGKDYILQDYILIIEKSNVNTCHRDNNGDFYNVGQKHPSYTLLIYLEPMEKCLGVIPKSHLNKNSFMFNVKDPIMNIMCKPGDAILFNSNLIHVGAMNKKDDNLRIQMKFTHIDDIPLLGYYENYHKVLNQENKVPPFIRHIQKRASCISPIIADLTSNENKRTSRGSEDGVKPGILQQIFLYLFYGNKDFYDMPSVF